MPDLTNPYTAPAEPDTADTVCENSTNGRKFRQILTATAIVSAVMLVQFCLLDFFVVRFRPYPDDVHDYDALFLLFPVTSIALLCLLANFRWLHLTVGMLIGSAGSWYTLFCSTNRNRWCLVSFCYWWTTLANYTSLMSRLMSRSVF